jgi:hypothetical protein
LKQAKVGYQGNTKSHETISVWFSKLCNLAGSNIRLENIDVMMCGPGHIVQVDESRFSKRKFEVGRAVRSPWIVGGIDVLTREFFFETLYRDSNTLSNIIINHVREGGKYNCNRLLGRLQKS